MSLLTDDIYWAHQPIELRAARSKFFTPSEALTLANQGFIVDWETMVWGWDPVLIMTLRSKDGYAWAPSALMQTPSDLNVLKSLPAPAGAILVSLNGDDYPPVTPPPSPSDQPLVGALNVLAPNTYYPTSACMTAVVSGAIANGYQHSEGGHSYVLNVSTFKTPFTSNQIGYSVSWTLIS